MRHLITCYMYITNIILLVNVLNSYHQYQYLIVPLNSVLSNVY